MMENIRIWSLCGCRGASSVGEETCIHTSNCHGLPSHVFSIIPLLGAMGYIPHTALPIRSELWESNNGIVPSVNNDNSSRIVPKAISGTREKGCLQAWCVCQWKELG